MSDIEKRLKRIERLLQELVEQGKPVSTTLHVSSIDGAFRRQKVERQQEWLKFKPRDPAPDPSKFHERIREQLRAERIGSPMHERLVAARNVEKDAEIAVRKADAAVTAAQNDSVKAQDALWAARANAARLLGEISRDLGDDDGTAGVPA